MLEPLLTPSSVAVVGASRSPGKVGHAVVDNLIKGGFEGPIVPINPHADEVLGLKCYPDIGAYGEPVELAVIVVPKPAVRPAIEGALKAGVKAFITITAGFREVGEEGAALEREIVRVCRSRNVPMLGPNSLGLLNTHHKMNASFATQLPKTGSISIVSQSGALCTAILDWAAGHHLGLGKLVSIGNKADLSEIDFLEALAEDDQTSVIVLYLESIGSGEEFIRVAEAASSKKPVLILKTGTTEAGAKAASSHTGSLAGADIAYGAAFRRAGVVRAATFESLLDYARAFAVQPLPKGNRVAIVTNAGGPGIMAADGAEEAGMTVGTLGGGTVAALKQRLPAAASVSNPIDVLGDADPERYAMAVEAAQDDETVDAVVIIMAPQAMTRPADTARAVAARVRGEKPVLAVFMGGADIMPGRAELAASNLPDFTSPERAIAALKAMVDYEAWRRRPPRVVKRFPVNRRRVERIIARHLRMGRHHIGEVDGKDVLRAYDFTVPDGEAAFTAEQAVDVALRVGFPVAIKIVSPDIIHKSDVGGVRLNLANPEAVRDAYDLMMLRIGQRAPDAELEGVYVEHMCDAGREVIIGMSRDPQFGPMLMFGLGGIFVEVMKDVTFHLAPITADEAMQMLQGTRSFALLQGARGQTGVDVLGIAQALQRVSQLVTDFPQITELDINPLIVGRVGTESVAADARITLSDARAQP
jgi:acetyl coenzyme A synthetase (ADP forming)-like protein